jgi:streptogramin lyase
MFHSSVIRWLDGAKKTRRAMRNRGRLALELLEDRCLLSPGVVGETPIPTANAMPGQIVVDGQGNQYFIEPGAQKIGKLTKAGAFTESPVISAISPPGVGEFSGIALGPDDNIYFAERNVSAVGRIGRSLAGSTLAEDSTGIGAGANLFGLTAASDGYIYFTLFNTHQIGRLPLGFATVTPATLSAAPPGFGPSEITFDAVDHNVYFTDFINGEIGFLPEGFTSGAAITESGATLNTAKGLNGITIGGDGNVWATNLEGAEVVRIHPGFAAGQGLAEFPLAAGDQPFGIVSGADGFLYTANGGVPGLSKNSTLSRIQLNGTATDISAGITANSSPLGITEAPDGNIFFTEVLGNKVGKFNVQHFIVTGADLGHEPIVNVFNADTGILVRSFYAYSPNFTGGVRVAVGDINHDGVPDIITAPGGVKVTLVNMNGSLFPSFDFSAGGPPEIKVFSGADGSRIADFLAYPASFTAGVFVAVADVNGDGLPDIITGPDATGQPGHTNVRIFFNGHLINTGGALAPDREFNAYASGFGGGVRVAAADFSGDNLADFVTAPGIWSGPDIRIWDLNIPLAGVNMIGEFLAYDFRYFGGVFVSTGDVNGDGLPDIVTGTNGNGGPEVKAFSGRTVLNNPMPTIVTDFFAYDPAFNGGARVAVVDFVGDGKADIVTAAGAGGTPDIRVIDGLTAQKLDEFLAYNVNFSGGVFIGAF